MSRQGEFHEFGPYGNEYGTFIPNHMGQSFLYEEACEYVRRIGRDKGWHYLPRVRSVLFVQRGHYTYAEVWVESPHHVGELVGVGFSKSRPSDKYNPVIGKNIAMRRAIEDAVNG